jgi:hypothetical protein
MASTENPRLWTPKIKDSRPYFEAKLKKGAIASVAQMTGTPVRTTIATSSATATTLAEYVMALTQDLQKRGIIA